MNATPPAGYRPCVGMMLIARDNRIFVGRRRDTVDAWQMPQGGIDPGEQPSRAALRELREEVGTDRATIVGESPLWRTYELPARLSGRLWGGRYRGQAQKWFALRFTGEDADFDLNTDHPEFDAWQWVGIDRLVDLAVPFKREVYRDVVTEFRHLIAEATAD